MCPDSDYLDRYQTVKEIRGEIQRCHGFIDSFLKPAYHLSDKQAALQRWEHRVSLLKAKLLLLGE